MRLNPCFNGRYSQREIHPGSPTHYQVLILVLMEDTLRASLLERKETLISVLILVLMEDTLRVIFFKDYEKSLCLNPCFNGRYSQSTATLELLKKGKEGLNPCFNGRYSQSARVAASFTNPDKVLILVLMEDTLREKCPLAGRVEKYVLILVLMEDTLRVRDDICIDIMTDVLILVLMEDTLRGKHL